MNFTIWISLFAFASNSMCTINILLSRIIIVIFNLFPPILLLLVKSCCWGWRRPFWHNTFGLHLSLILYLYIYYGQIKIAVTVFFFEYPYAQMSFHTTSSFHSVSLHNTAVLSLHKKNVVDTNGNDITIRNAFKSINAKDATNFFFFFERFLRKLFLWRKRFK